MASHSFCAKISKTVIDRLQPGDTVWDTELKGFGARKQRQSVSYIMKAFHKGRQRWLTIGKHGQPWSPAMARQRALEIKIAPDVSEKPKPANTTIADIIPLFRAEHFPKIKLTTREGYDFMFKNHILPALGRIRVADLAHSELSDLHNKKQENPRTGNLMLSMMSKILNWAEENNYRPQGSNPCHRIKKFPETRRERFLTLNELGALGEALTQLGVEGKVSPYAAAAIRLLVLTGARRNEILTLEWSHVDFERQKLFLPQSKTGRKSISLNSQAVEILKSIRCVSSNRYVIIGKIDGAHMVNIAKPWNLVRERANLEGVRIHDLRHSYASIAAAQGGSLPMIGKLLGHTQTQTTARYAHLADAPLEKLSQKVGTTIGDAMKIKR